MNVDLNACIDGDKQAWDDFVDHFCGVIYAAVQRTFGRRGTGVDRSAIDDAVQDVFLRLVKDDYRLLRSYDPNRASLSTWLTVVTRSVAIDYLRKTRRGEALTEPILEGHVTATPPPARGAGGPSLPLHLLTARQRLVLRLLFDEELSVQEAAEVIGVDAQTIRSTKHKAITRLREQLNPT